VQAAVSAGQGHNRLMINNKQFSVITKMKPTLSVGFSFF